MHTARLLPLLFALALPIQAAAIPFDGKDWAQPADFTGFSWDEVSTVCPSGGGACSGSLTGLSGTRDFTGWTWATVGEVASLFRSVESAFPGIDFAVLDTPLGSVLETVFLGPGGFLSTAGAEAQAGGFSAWVWAWSATPSCPAPCVDHASAPAVVVWPTGGLNRWTTTAGRGPTVAGTEYGVWLYRTGMVSIPEPSAFALLVVAPLAVAWRARGRRDRLRERCGSR